MSNPRFSVLIPVYNVEDYLEDCLNSVIGQTFSNFEVICVEDGSTDKSPEILKEFAKKDERIKIIYHSENKGLLAGRVTGVKEAKGDYIVFLDSDDSLKENALEYFDAQISKCPVEIYMCNMDLEFSNNVGKLNKKSAKVYFGAKKQMLFSYKILFECFKKKRYAHNVIGKVIRNDLCQKVYNRVVDDKIVMCEDMYAYFMLSYFAKTFKSTNKKLYNYNLGRGVTGGKTYSYGLYKKYCQIGYLFFDLEKFLKENNAEKEYFNLVSKMKKKYCDMLVYDYCYEVEEENKKEAGELLSNAYGEGEKGENEFHPNIQKSIDENIKLGKFPENLFGKFKRKVRKDGFFFTVFWAFKMLFKIR